VVSECLELASRAGVQAPATVHERIRTLADALDEVGFDVHDAADEGRASTADYHAAFGLARAATSVVCCLEPSARKAAATACYEALAALGDGAAAKIMSLAHETLDGSSA
jgi:hypothetical protein